MTREEMVQSQFKQLTKSFWIYLLTLVIVSFSLGISVGSLYELFRFYNNQLLLLIWHCTFLVINSGLLVINWYNLKECHEDIEILLTESEKLL
jgi:hypothetical protein